MQIKKTTITLTYICAMSLVLHAIRTEYSGEGYRIDQDGLFAGYAYDDGRILYLRLSREGNLEIVRFLPRGSRDMLFGRSIQSPGSSQIPFHIESSEIPELDVDAQTGIIDISVVDRLTGQRLHALRLDHNGNYLN